MFHCHIEFHVEVGMALVFKVGEHDEMPPVPLHFPQCGNYMTELSPAPVCDTSFNLMKLLPFISEEHCNSHANLQSGISSFKYIFIMHLVLWLYCKNKFYCI